MQTTLIPTFGNLSDIVGTLYIELYPSQSPRISKLYVILISYHSVTFTLLIGLVSQSQFNVYYTFTKQMCIYGFIWYTYTNITIHRNTQRSIATRFVSLLKEAVVQD
ncbi:hypothetical protein BDQ12DRAFT_230742 [Crucibulum laeve]|uniref:Uncharacterized protein n=1 Tax=Crucibulum laeve TaxID=68775 RepID=A0A5C3LWK7_9AGAR|nr:hypothetical protein BDQ12DRAFT_230742 [Crucibulum laeve]